MTTASLRIVPPCTVIWLPSSDTFFSFSTLYRQFLITEYESPAAMSSISAPSRSTCFTLEFMNTVHLVPRSQGALLRQAAAAKSATP